LSLLTSFIVAGFHSTVAGMSTLLYYIGADRALRDRLIAEPNLINGAVEEGIGSVPPLQLFRRCAAEATRLGGGAIRGSSGGVRGAERWLSPACGPLNRRRSRAARALARVGILTGPREF